MQRFKFIATDEVDFEDLLEALREYDSTDVDRVEVESVDGREIVATFDGPLAGLAMIDVTINFCGTLLEQRDGEWVDCGL